MNRFARFLYQPVLPLGKNHSFVTNSRSHWDLAKKIAAEGTVLLKNDGTLPLSQGEKICLFGTGIGEFLFGGGGSGRVFTEKKIDLAQGLANAEKEGKISLYQPLVDFYKEKIGEVLDKARAECGTIAKYNAWRSVNMTRLPVLPEQLYSDAKAFGTVAVFCISRHSSEGDGFGDRSGLEGDFYMWDEEKALLDRLSRDYEKVVVILNTCGPVSVKEFEENPGIGAVLYPLYSGGIAGEVLAELLLGEKYPSGHLQHTLAKRLEDYPSTEGYFAAEDHEDYTEDIFVGYRYFETFAKDKVVYPYGFGLGYTKFETKVLSASFANGRVKISVSVKNVGKFSGKEVVQAYLSAPQAKLGKAAKVLTAFSKTKELRPSEETVLKLDFSVRDFASFDDLGKIKKSAFVLEKGEYAVYVGTNVRDAENVLDFSLSDDIICKKCHSYMAPRALEKRLTADGSYEDLPKAESCDHKPVGTDLRAEAPAGELTLAAALEKNMSEEFLAGMTPEEMTEMLYGHPMMNASNTNGIGLSRRDEYLDKKYVPLVPTADGPAGLRIREGRGITPTFFPCESTVSQTWNLDLANRMGVAAAKETKENNIGIWLAPALNIQRNPRCGRNFEYYSEDPLTSGLFAAACVRGVQSQSIVATIKHYCANNREMNRRIADSRVSERALREIYLKGFEIAIKKGDPWALMTSYNPVNGVQMSANWEAINGILRGEWKYDGVVMTDWRVLSNLDEEIHAGSDVKMPALITPFYKNAPESCDPAQMFRDGSLDRKAVISSCRRILKMMAKLD